MSTVETPPVQPTSETVVPPVTTPTTPPVTPPVATVPPVTPPAPITYDLKIAETSPLSQADVDAVLAVAKEHSLSNEQAALLLSQRETAVTELTTRSQEALNANKAAWVSEVQADKVMGGDNYNATLASVKLVMDHFTRVNPTAAAVLEAGLNESGLGSHPAFVALISYIGKQMGEDKGLGSSATGGGGGGEKSLEKSFYPNR